jgi:hypothetical protein
MVIGVNGVARVALRAQSPKHQPPPSWVTETFDRVGSMVNWIEAALAVDAVKIAAVAMAAITNLFMVLP